MLKNSEKVRAKIMLKQPKRTVNLYSSVNCDEVLWWRETESEQMLMLSAVKEYCINILDAKEREFNSLEDNYVFNWVENHDQGSVSCKCYFTEKQKENGSKMLKT